MLAEEGKVHVRGGGGLTGIIFFRWFLVQRQNKQCLMSESILRQAEFDSRFYIFANGLWNWFARNYFFIYIDNCFATYVYEIDSHRETNLEEINLGEPNVRWVLLSMKWGITFKIMTHLGSTLSQLITNSNFHIFYLSKAIIIILLANQFQLVSLLFRVCHVLKGKFIRQRNNLISDSDSISANQLRFSYFNPLVPRVKILISNIKIFPLSIEIYFFPHFCHLHHTYTSSLAV